MQEVVARVARNEIDSTPTQERASIDAIPESACNFYNLDTICDAHSNIGNGRAKTTFARKNTCSVLKTDSAHFTWRYGGYGAGFRL
jgi:hypothetical protein